MLRVHNLVLRNLPWAAYDEASAKGVHDQAGLALRRSLQIGMLALCDPSQLSTYMPRYVR